MQVLLVLSPLFGALLGGLISFQNPRHIIAPWVTTLSVLMSAFLSWMVFAQTALGGGEAFTLTLFPWFDIGAFQSVWSVRVDSLSAVMMVVVMSVSALVHIYSWGYMSHDPGRGRFFAYLSFFTFAMLVLVTADDFLQLFFGWEGVGLASYLLIGFWFKKPSANRASIKAFVVNRVGDIGLALGIMTLFWTFGSVSFDTVFAAVPDKASETFQFLGMSFNLIELIAFLFFVGAMGKSAQFFLHVWLPDAMEGPTPVSALIHAATMVTAGVFLVCRCSEIYQYAPHASAFVTIIGSVTALFAATIGLAQNDIKRVIAYSTCSQLGYMFFAAGLGAYNAAMFHLFTHAFFKALLFLGAGSVIHALSDEQDMRRMGGLYKVIPLTWVMMLIGTLALTGVGIPGTHIGFAGFFSKDAIIETSFAASQQGYFAGSFAFLSGLFAAFLTSFYSWRLMFMVFHGSHREDQGVLEHAHESPPVMTIPLIVLALGAVLAGLVFYHDFWGEGMQDFWNGALFFSQSATTLLKAAHHVPFWVKLAPFIVTLSGFLLAWAFYIRHEGLAAKIAKTGGPLHAFLKNKWYFDEIYHVIFVRGTKCLGDVLWKTGDKRLIDGLGPDGMSALSLGVARRLRKLQSGYVYHYAFVMLLGVVIFVSWMLVRTSGGAG